MHASTIVNPVRRESLTFHRNADLVPLARRDKDEQYQGEINKEEINEMRA